MLRRADVDDAISQIAAIRSAQEAAARARECARALLGTDKSALTGMQQAQEWILAISLYFAAAADSEGTCRFAKLVAMVEERHQKALAGASDEELFEPLIEYPQPLLQDLRALASLPRELVMECGTKVRNMLVSAN